MNLFDFEPPNDDWISNEPSLRTMITEYYSKHFSQEEAYLLTEKYIDVLSCEIRGAIVNEFMKDY